MVLGIGMDIQQIERLVTALKRGGKRFRERTFTPNEISYCQRQHNPGQHFTGRFCAKEAFFKALGTGWAKGIGWTEVEVVKDKSGKPELRLSGHAKSLAGRARVKRIWLSLSHSRDYAAATVILEG